jgi:pyruvate ferredoxin oxidoreductase alpha subunit
VRTFTATSSQGLALMHEMLYAAPQIRLPIVMVNVNRSLGAASGIWLEHNDSMPERESGWIQVYVEDNQEALDMVLQGFRIAEDERVMMPIMICLDGFVLSHTVEKVEIPDQLEVDRFLPKFKPMNMLDPGDPRLINPLVPPEYATEMRYQLDRAMDSSRVVIKEIDESFARTFGRGYGGLFDTYEMKDAEFALLSLGTATTTARGVVDELRSQGKKAGLIKMRFMRPFPEKELLEATKDLKALGVFDRSVSFNSFGPMYTEVRGALRSSHFPITDHIAGLGGRDLTIEDMREIYTHIEENMAGKAAKEVCWYGLRGQQR